MTRLLTWNVNGIRAVMKKGFEQILDMLAVDVLCVQETKAQQDQIELSRDLFPYQYASCAVKKGYSGTLIASVEEPLSVSYGIGVEEFDQEGRTVTAEFTDFILVDVYVPNSGEGLKRLDFRMRWDQAFEKYLRSLNKPLLVCGDFNGTGSDLDLYDPQGSLHTAGGTPQEREGLHKLYEVPLVDVWRTLNPDRRQYSWWSYYDRGREKGQGWRIDYWLASPSLMDAVRSVEILDDVYGSDHCPVLLEISLPLAG